MSKKSKDFPHWHFPFNPDDNPNKNYDGEFADEFSFPEFDSDFFNKNIKRDPLLDDENDWNAD
jgi:hypothetical protein